MPEAGRRMSNYDAAKIQARERFLEHDQEENARRGPYLWNTGKTIICAINI